MSEDLPSLADFTVEEEAKTKQTLSVQDFTTVPSIVDFAKTEEPGQFELGLSRGTFEAGMSLGGGLEVVGSMPGLGFIKEAGRGLSEASKAKLDEYALPKEADVVDLWNRLGDSKAGADEVGDWFLYTLGNAGPSMAATVAAGAVGTALGGPVGLAAAGGYTGMGSMSFLLNAGEVYTNLREKGEDAPGAAAAAGIPMALLDVLTPGRLFGKVVWKPTKLGRGSLGRILKETGVTTGLEGITEAGQEVIGAGTESLVTGEDFLTPETMSRVINAFAAGAVAGGAFGGAGQTIAEVNSNITKIPSTPVPGTDLSDITPQEKYGSILDDSAVRQGIEPLALEVEQQVQATVESLQEKPAKKRTAAAIVNDLVAVIEPLTTAVPEITAKQLRKKAVKAAINPLVEELGNRKVSDKQLRTLVEKRVGVDGNVDGVVDAIVTARTQHTVLAPTVVAATVAPEAPQSTQIIEETAPPNTEILLTPKETGYDYDALPNGTYKIESDSAQETSELMGHVLAADWIRLLPDAERQQLEETYTNETREQKDFETVPFGHWLLRNIGIEGTEKRGGFLWKVRKALKFHHATEGITKPFGVWLEELGQNSRIALRGIIAVPEPGRSTSEQQDFEKSLFELTKDFKKVPKSEIDGMDTYESDKLKTALDKTSWFSRNMLTLIQFGEQNKHIKVLQAYIEQVRQFWADKTFFTSTAHNRISEVKKNLNSHEVDKVGRYLLEQTLTSYDQKRLMDENDNLALADKHKLSPEARIIATKMSADFQMVLRQFKEEQLAEVDRRLSLDKDAETAAMLRTEIERDYSVLENRNYFPLSRFGHMTVTVIAKQRLNYAGKNYNKGATVAFYMDDRKGDQKESLADAKKRFSSGRYAITTGIVEENEFAFQGFPPSLMASMEKDLALTEDQKRSLKEAFIRQAPGAGFTKHMLGRRGIAGFSEDILRIYSDYMSHASNHFARLRNYRGLAEKINEVGSQISAIRLTGGDTTPRQKVKQYMNEHYRYLMNPGNEMAAARAFIFTWFFIGNARQALVNLTQVPLFTYGHLAAQYGDIETSKVLSKTYIDAAKALRNPDVYTEEEGQLLEMGVQAGFINQSLATEAAAMSHGEGLHRMTSKTTLAKAGNWISNMGLWPFKATEGLNRRVSFIATVRLAKEKGITDQRDLFELGRDVVTNTQFEYERPYRMPITRGNRGLGAIAPVLFMFQSFLQGTLYFYATQPGRGRALVAMLALAGIMGLPGADDMADVIEFFVTKLGKAFGMKDPYFDARKMLRDGLTAMNVHPDLAMHGASRYTMGLYGLNMLTGMPIPAIDLSGSLSLGRVIPGIESVFSLTAKPEQRVARALEDVGGVAAGLGVSWGRALFSDNFRDWQRAMPPVLKNMMMATQAASEGAYTDRNGNPLVPIDPLDNEHSAELISQFFLGTQPTRLRQVQEKNWAKLESRLYYQIRRELVLKDLAFATIAKDRNGKADAMKALRDYNMQAPPGLGIAPRDMKRSLEARIKNRALREMGLPTEKRYRIISQQYDPSFPTLD